jgi:hypothetical protein
MLAHHPITGAPIRILKTAPTIYSDEKTLVWIRASFEASQRWSRWSVAISEPEAVRICGAGAVGLVMLPNDATVDAWKTTFQAIFTDESTALLVGPSSVITDFESAGLTSSRTFVVEDLYDLYPYLGEPLKKDDDLTKVLISMAHILRHNRIALVGDESLVSKKDLQKTLEAWAHACCKTPTPNLLYLSDTATDVCVPRCWMIQQYYVDSNNRRAREIRTCLEKNLACEFVDHVLLLNESNHDLPAHPKLQSIILGHRLRYFDIFVAIKSKIPAGDFIVFANSDIYLNETLSYLWKIGLEQNRMFLSLLRWEEGEPPVIFGPRADSQDAWIIARNCVDFEPDEEELGFPFGKPGCDNAISLIMMRKRFFVSNPAYSIKTIHLHSSQIRRYNPRDVLYRAHYLYVEPSAIQGFSVVSDMNEKRYNPSETIVKAWNTGRLGSSFARPILCDKPADVATVCSMLRREGTYNFLPEDANLWTPPPSGAPLYCIKGGSFVNSAGLVSNFREILTGGNPVWTKNWETTLQSTLMPCVHVPSIVAVSFEESWGKSLGKWALHYLPRALAVRETVRAGGHPPPEFIVPQIDSIGAFLADCKWAGADSRGNITVVPYLEESNYYADTVWAVPPLTEKNLPTAEDIALLRSLLPHEPKFESKPIVVFCVEDDPESICSRVWAEMVAENLFHTGWTVRYVGSDDNASTRRKAFADASWIFGGDAGLDWIWLAGKGATVMEFVKDYEPNGDHIHLAGAAGLRYIMGVIKREPLMNQRQGALLSIAAALEKYGFCEILTLTKPPESKPVVILPMGAALNGIWAHAGDTFREMAEIWGERGFVRIERSESTPFCWWGGIGKVLLYDRPTPRWWSLPPPYQMALFGNCAPPGPGPHLLKQSVWCFWGRRPRLLEGVASRVENMRGYDSRSIKSLFLGKVENGVQFAARSGADWSSAVDLFSMPIDSTGKPYPYSAEQYLEKLCDARFGLCLPGYGPKCNREIEYFCCGTVPIVTPGVDMKNYLVPPKLGVHYFVANTPEEVRIIVEKTPPERWAAMSAAGREWWRMYASAEGLFRLTLTRITQCQPYLNVGIPKNFLV